MKRIIVVFCLCIGFILCGLIVNKNSVASDEKDTMTMTELYESNVAFSRNIVITIESKEELILFNKYIEKGNNTSRITFSLINDIYWSDYEFKYDKDSDRLGVYKNNTLQVVYGWELNESQEFFKVKEYKNFVTKKENTEEKYQFQDDFWVTSDKAIWGNFEGNNHTIYGLLLKGSFFNATYGNIMNLTFSNVYSENGEGVLAQRVYNGNIVNCNIEKGYVFKNKNPEDTTLSRMGMIGYMNGGSITDCEVDACCVYDQDSGYAKGESFFGMLLGDVVDVDQICNNHVQGIMKVRGCDKAGGIAGKIHYENYNNGYTEIISCKNSADIDGGNSSCMTGGITSYLLLEGNARIEDCQNEGTIISGKETGGLFGRVQSEGGRIEINECINLGDITHNYFELDNCGGLIGWVTGNDYYLKIRNCMNQGNITSLKYSNTSAGGIVGIINYETTGLYSPEIIIENCSNQGDISVLNHSNIGGICNVVNGNSKIYNQYISVSNCYNSGTLKYGEGNAGEIAGTLMVGTIQNCYYLQNGTNNAVGDNMYGEINEVYAVTENQLLGTEITNKISSYGYANAFTLLESLNNWVQTQETEFYSEWTEGSNGPKLKNIEFFEPDSTITPLPTAATELVSTPTPTMRPTVAPTITPRPTLVPTTTPILTAAPTPFSTTTPVLTAAPIPVPTATPVLTAAPIPLPTATPGLTAAPTPYMTATSLPTMDVSSEKRFDTNLSTTIPTKDPYRNEDTTIIQTPVTIPTQTPKPSDQSKTDKKSKKMRAPTFTLKKKKTSSDRNYIQLRLKKYKGKYIEIKVKKKTKYYILKLNNANIKKNKKIFNISYSSLKGKISFKIRTYVKSGKKKTYSKYSKVRRIRLS